MPWNVVLPDGAQPGDEGHVNDHNAIVDAVTEVRNSVDNMGAGSGFDGTDVSVTAPIVKSGTASAITLSAPTALVASNIKAGTNISVSANGNDVTVNALSDSTKLVPSNIKAGTNITLSVSGNDVTVNSSATTPAPTGFPHVINVMNSPYSAVGDGSTDDTTAIQNAITAAQNLNNAVVQLGPKHLISSELTIASNGIRIQGWGPRNTVLIHKSTHTGWMFKVTGATRGGQWDDADTTYTLTSDMSGVEFVDLMINPGTRAVVHHGIRLLRADDVVLQNVAFGYLNGTALQVGGDGSATTALEAVYGGTFNNLSIKHCGSGSFPALSIQCSNTYSTGDASSDLMFTNLRFAQNHGPLKIVNSNTTKFMKNIQFLNTELYALSTENIDTVSIEGKVSRVTFSNVTGTGVPASYALFRLNSSGTPYPDSIVIDNLHLYNVVGSGLIVNKCNDITFRCRPDTTNMSGKIVTIDSTSSLNAYTISLDGVTTPVTTAGFLSIDTTLAQKGSVSINGHNRSAPKILTYTGSAYPTRGTDAAQTHMYVGNVDPTGSGFIVGVDVWIDTSGG